MSKSILIVESPAKCKKIQSYLGNGFIVKASLGHFREISKGLKSIDKNYVPKFTIAPGKQKVVNDLKKHIAGANTIYLATDDDREGEAIAWHICDHFNLSIADTPRIIFHEITKSAIQKAVQSPTRLNMNKVNAQFARQVLDLIVGYTVSPLLWTAIPRDTYTGTLSAGRCQTPALRLVYDREKEIEASPGELIYSIIGIFLKTNTEFQLESSDTKALDTFLSDKENVETFLEDNAEHEHKFQKYQPRATKHTPPKPFTTSTLQQQSNTECRMKPGQTMKAAQTLYEQGYITYMRTDNPRYSKEFIDKCSVYIRENYGDDYCAIRDEIILGGNQKKSKDKTAQEAHEAIRPTNIATLPNSISSPLEKKLYRMIWQNTMASCMANATGKQIKVTITSPLKNPESYFITKQEQLVFAGWKIVYQNIKNNEEYKYIERMREKQRVAYKKIKASPTLKHSKLHYTEAKLVQILEKNGIGRPSTFSSLVQKIQQRNYANVENISGKKLNCSIYTLTDEIIEEEKDIEFNQEKNKLNIQSLGKNVIDYLMNETNPVRQLFEYDYTSRLESQLDEIAEGRTNWKSVVRECDDLLNKSVKPLKEQAKEQSTKYKIEQYGSVEAYKESRKDKTKPIGEYQNKPIYIRTGKFGDFAQIGETKDNDKKTVSLKSLKKPYNLESVIERIKHPPLPKGAIRVFNSSLSLRKGKYNEYIFYKTSEMKKPIFINIRSYKGDIHKDKEEKVIEWAMQQIN
jgi:DNA topoisomerase-1